MTKTDTVLSAEQQRALDRIEAFVRDGRTPTFYLEYAEGSGPMVLLDALIDRLGAASVQMAAPNGHTAKQMSERTGQVVLTYHKLIYHVHAGDDAHSFIPRRDGPLGQPDTRLVVIADAEKLRTREAAHLLAAGKPVLLCANANKVPLDDAFIRARTPDAELVTVMRQSPEAPTLSAQPPGTQLQPDALTRMVSSWLDRYSPDGTWFQINLDSLAAANDGSARPSEIARTCLSQALRGREQDFPRPRNLIADTEGDLGKLRQQLLAGDTLLLESVERWGYGTKTLRMLALNGDMILFTRTGHTGPVAVPDENRRGVPAAYVDTQKLSGNLSLQLENDRPVRIVAGGSSAKFNICPGDLFVPAS